MALALPNVDAALAAGRMTAEQATAAKKARSGGHGR
jgi:hypothetical protein